MPQTFVFPRQVALDDDANPLSGALLFFFQTGTTTPQAVYSDAALTTPHSNPVVADAAGEFPKIYLNPNAEFNYRSRFATADGVQLYQEDDIDRQATISQASIAQTLYPRTQSEISASVTPVNYARFPSPWKDISRFVSDNTGVTDVTTQMQNAFVAEKNIMIPAGGYKITSPISVRAGVTVTGAGAPLAAINAYGCNAFTVDGDFSVIEKLALFSLSSGGASDPRTHDGVKITGVNGTQRNSSTVRDCYFQGWLNCINWEYAWDCLADNIRTANAERGVRIYGEAVNNFISNSKLLVNSGDASILTLVNGADRSEGLLVINSLLASGDYGIKSDGLVGLSVIGCIIDLIASKGMELTGVTSLNVDCPWIYAASSCIDLIDQGAPLNVGGSITVANAQTTGIGGHTIRIGTNNNGVAVHGGMVQLGNAASANYPIAMLAAGCVQGVFVVNDTAQKGILVSAADATVSGNSGACTVNRTVSPNFTATLTGCATSPTGVINYEVIGEDVVLEVLTAIEGTSNDTAATITGLPAALYPARVQQVMARTKNDGTINSAVWQIGTGGVITLFASAASATFTGSGTKGAPPQTLRYKRS